MSDFSARRVIMVDTQVRPSDVTKFPIIDAMLAVPRENFVPRDKREAAYVDGNIVFGEDRALLEPRTLAKMLDALDLQNDELVLDIGSALGYSASVIAHIAQAVVAVEADEALSSDAQTALSEAGIDNVVVHTADLATGAPEYGPYDAIVVEGGVEVISATLIDQLKDGGRIAAVFMTGALGEVRIGHKKNGSVHWRLSFNASAPILPGFAAEREFAL